MRQARDIWLWLLLVPYFAVLSLNVDSWFPGQKRIANRTNAQGALALVFASIALPLLNATGITSGFGRDHPFWLGFFLVVPAMLAVHFWLNAGREAEYHKTYRAMAPLLKIALGLVTAAVAAVCLWLSFRS